MTSLARRLAPPLAAAYLRLVGATTRTAWEGREHAAALDSAGKNYIYAFWHARQALFAWTHRGGRVMPMISRSADGELIARTIERFGLKAARGSSSRGGAAALGEMLGAIAEGWHPAFTPDGPKGPACEVKPGVLRLARRTGLPVIPIANALSNKIVFRSWDRFQLPLPLGRAAVVLGAPLAVGEDLDAAARALKTALDAVSARAEELVA